ncbi:lipid-A-disaccharide synthase [Halothece sp. PCC 7418]|uniref:lipid-A-disaccharide synthase n=1 Tax=Halothece sp. (strain PCC 7418) TaxID=65093 RepID=UPI0002A06C66|nr:lipid-A-disaccharide synthase [Halothece sp. PCC 7418]AFZ44642.1 lipid-A-disaccharide synthase [Halothece sp. PCC 7418]
MSRVFISTGEVSGDLQGALLVEALYRQAQAEELPLEVFALGGERMAKAGATLLGNTTNIGSVGILESLPFVLPTLKVQRRAKAFLRESPPDVLVLIDYMGPNLAIGNYVRQYLPQLPIVYYIAPQAWVWSPFPEDANAIARVSDRLLAVFPEEARFFAARGVNVTWVGHPLLDRMETAPSRDQARQQLAITDEETIVALIPASRRQEIQFLLPVILEAAVVLQEKCPDVKFLLPLSNPEFLSAIETAIDQYSLVVDVVEDTLSAIAAADLAITKSGTVNLELALLNVPQVVLYRVNPLTIWLGRTFLNFSVPFISPTNLVVNQPIVPELLQEDATVSRVVQEAIALLRESSQRNTMLKGYQQVRAGLGEVGVRDRAAKEILSLLPS